MDRTSSAGRQRPWLSGHGGFCAAARALQIGDDDRFRGSVCSVKDESGGEFTGLGVEVFGIGVPNEEVGTWRDWRGRRRLGGGQRDAGEEHGAQPYQNSQIRETGNLHSLNLHICVLVFVVRMHAKRVRVLEATLAPREGRQQWPTGSIASELRCGVLSYYMRRLDS